MQIRGIEKNNCPNVILNPKFILEQSEGLRSRAGFVKNLHGLVKKDPSQSLRACPRAQRRNDIVVFPWDILLFPHPLNVCCAFWYPHDHLPFIAIIPSVVGDCSDLCFLIFGGNFIEPIFPINGLTP